MRMQEKLTITFYQNLITTLHNNLHNFLNGLENQMYYTSLKICSDALLDNIFEDVNETDCCAIVYDFYKQKWERAFNVLTMKYNPLENYSMSEMMTDYENRPGTETSFHDYHEKTTGVSATGTTTMSGKDITSVSATAGNVSVTETITEKPTTENSVTSMDDTTPHVHDKQMMSGDSAEKILNSGYTDTEKTGLTKNENVDTGIVASADTNHLNVDSAVTGMQSHIGTRSGNIGVTTSQQMLESELSIAERDKMLYIIVSDICDFFNGGVYDDSNII